jgi:hypothetical protein
VIERPGQGYLDVLLPHKTKQNSKKTHRDNVIAAKFKFHSNVLIIELSTKGEDEP